MLSAENRRTALGHFLTQRESVRVVLTDVMMPGMDGVELTRALRALAPQLPIVATSGLLNDERQEALRQLGVSRIIAKPCAAHEVLEALREALTSAESNAAGSPPI